VGHDLVPLTALRNGCPQGEAFMRELLTQDASRGLAWINTVQWNQKCSKLSWRETVQACPPCDTERHKFLRVAL
jgi:hypothetical protein